VSARHKTLFFCTSHLLGAPSWRERQRRWLDHHRALPIERDATFILDDASPYVPDDADVVVVDRLPASLPVPPTACLYRFATHEGRSGMTGHRGWWRSFLFSYDIALAYGFDKIVHLESDACLLSRRIVEYVNAVDSGWVALWCERWKFPETAIQVIAADRFGAMAELRAKGLDELTQRQAEYTLPFTHVCRDFTGDRYGEFRLRIPGYADYACEVRPAMWETLAREAVEVPLYARTEPGRR
jgi:hypothetical protein